MQGTPREVKKMVAEISANDTPLIKAINRLCNSLDQIAVMIQNANAGYSEDDHQAFNPQPQSLSGK